MIIISETLVITLLGSLLHFAYGWSKKNKFVGIFAAVNESTWEHVKLALSATIICMLVDIWFLGDNPNYWLARSVSMAVMVIVIPMIFYGYTSFTRRAVLPVDILTFLLAAFLGSVTFVAILNAPAIGAVGDVISMILGVIILTMYLLLTIFPMKNNLLFEDPINHKYGFDAFAEHHKNKSRSKQRK